MRLLKTVTGPEVMVDDDLYESLSTYRWYVNTDGYIIRKYYDAAGKKRAVMMHREINNTPAGMVTDHIDGNKSNNQRSNLRTTTQRQNTWNQVKRKTNKSGYIGVHDDSKSMRTAPWRAHLLGKYLGHYATREEAAKARDTEAMRIYGQYAKLNFPESASKEGADVFQGLNAGEAGGSCSAPLQELLDKKDVTL